MRYALFLLAWSAGILGCAADETNEGETESLAQAIDAAVVTPTTDGGVRIESTAIGKACSADSDCKAPATKCQKSVSVAFVGININYPDGYCTTACKSNAECGQGAGCPMAGAAALLPALSSCLKHCDTASDCRSGYSCAVVPALALPGFGPPAPAATAPAQKHCLPPLPI